MGPDLGPFLGRKMDPEGNLITTVRIWTINTDGIRTGRITGFMKL